MMMFSLFLTNRKAIVTFKSEEAVASALSASEDQLLLDYRYSSVFLTIYMPLWSIYHHVLLHTNEFIHKILLDLLAHSLY